MIEKGFVTKAKVKWWGGIDYQYPYLWKDNKADVEYKKSWNDPREKTEKQKQSKTQNVTQKKEKKKGLGF